jgi:ribose 5-phosphate isomerase B
MIYISSDHRGFELKKFLVEELEKEDIHIEDLGPKDINPEDDYPDYAKIVAEKIQENPENMGIVICANGVGISIAANKFDGVRAALSWNPVHAASTRNDDGANVLALPADYITKEEALITVQRWLTTNFSGEERHIRRLVKLASFEEEEK